MPLDVDAPQWTLDWWADATTAVGVAITSDDSSSLLTCAVPDGTCEVVEALLGATVSVGDNPTFDDVDGKQVEAYIHDLDERLYGCVVEVHLAMHLRPMLKFPTLAELIAHTAADVQRSRTVLTGSRPPDVD